MRSILLGVLGVLWSMSVFGASTEALWRDVEPSRVAPAGERFVEPDRARTLALDYAALAEQLKTAPQEAVTAVADSSFELSLPRPEGGYERFRLVESSILAPTLAARFPTLKTYVGQGIDDPSATLRVDLTGLGFRAQWITWDRTIYIEPFQRQDLAHYVVFRKDDYRNREPPMVCQVTGEEIKQLPNFQQRGKAAKVVSGATRRTYRVAIAATGEYTAAFGGTVVDALGAIVTTMNRVNGIYEREVSVRMVLIGNNDQIIYTDGATDPYTNDDGLAMLTQNQNNLTALIGGANYDIGHVFSTGGGGVATLGSVCGATIKARGVTGLGNPRGDAFDVDYVAHEMGHQFNGRHTFNSTAGACTGNRSSAAAYETGSGVTIQAYAGICGADNLQANSEDYFHRFSLNEILAFTTNASTGASCGTTNSTGNTPPTVSAPADLTIPISTPFQLTATGSDINGDTLTYSWEQFNLGPANTAGSITDNGTSPLFRNFDPSPSPTRIFPSLRYILGNANVAPVTAPLPGTSSPSFLTAEVLPSTSRTLDFVVTARDNRAGGGGTNEDTIRLTTTTAAGPFVVTAPNTGVVWAAGSTQTVQWNVAGTTANGVNTAQVEIALSRDGGNTFPTILAAATANDGTETVTIPAGTAVTNQARIRVAAVGNVFFDVSDVNFQISGSNTVPTLTVTGSVSTTQGAPAASANVATVGDAQDAAGNLAVSLSQVPPELTVSVSNTAGTVRLTAAAGCTLVAPASGTRIYPVLLTVTDSGGASTSLPVNVAVGTNVAPTLGSYGNLAVSTGGSASSTPSAPPADGNNNLTAASVSPLTLPGSAATAVSIAANGVVTVSPAAGTTPGVYSITAQANDSCGASRTRRFDVTVSANAPLLSVSGTQVIGDNNRLDPNDCNALNLTVANAGTAATQISAVLSSSTPGVTVTQPNSAYPNLAGGASAANLTAFQVSTDNTVANGSTANFTLTLSYTGGGSPAVLNFSLPVGALAGYTFASGSGASIPAGGTLVPGSNVDDGLFALTVPFALQVYDSTIAAGSAIRASTNGNLQLVASGGSRQWSNSGLPAPGTGDVAGDAFPTDVPVLFPYWDDLLLTPTGGGIYTQTTGSAPNRQFIVEWRGRTVNDGATTVNLVFAVVFTEGSSSVQYRYVQTGVGGAANGAGATVGVQRATTGTQFTQHALNQAVITPGLVLTGTFSGPQAGSGVCAAATVSVSPTSIAISEAGPTSANVLISLNQAPTSNVTTTLSFDGNLQVNTGSGFGASPQTVTLTPANALAGVTVSVRAVDDAIDEASPHASVVTTSVTSSTQAAFNGLAVADVTAAITDNDTAGVTITRSGGSNAVSEAGTTDSYTLVLTSQPTATVNVAVGFPASDLSLSGDTDGSFNTSFTTANWNTPQTVTLAAINDRALEGAHEGSLVHAFSSADAGYQGITALIDGSAGNTMPVAITDNETAVLNWVPASGSAAEGANNPAVVQLDITADPAGGTPTLEGSIGYGVTSTLGTAEAADLGTLAGPLVFSNVGDLATNTLTLPHLDDTLVEGNESYSLTLGLSAPLMVGVSVAPTAYAGTIVDGDSATLTLSGTATVGEAAGSTALTATLGTAAGHTLEGAVTVAVNLADGTATFAAGAGDYFFTGPANTTALSFPAGAGNATTRSATVNLREDVLVEGSESFGASLGTVTGAASVAGSAVTITVTDNDIAAIGFQSPTSTVGEETTPHTVNAVLTITAVGSGTASLAVPVSVAVTQTPGTATTPADYSLGTPSLSYAAGTATAATRPISIAIVDDAVAEASESFGLGFGTLTGPATATGGHTVTITDNDGQATTTTITDDTPDPSVVGQPYTVTVNVAGAFSQPTGSITVSDGSASCGPVTLSAATGVNSTASCALTSTSAGAKTLVATYTPASSAFAGSSGSTTHQVNAAATTLVVTGPARSRINQAATYGFTLAVSAPGAGTPQGTVTISSPGGSCSVSVPTATPSCALTPTSLGPRTISASFTPTGGNFLGSASSGAGNVQTVVFALADLAVTKTDGVGGYLPGAVLVYTITVRNNGPDAATGIRVRDVVPAALTSVQWTCEASGGVACPQPSGTGNIDATTGGFPVSGQLSYILAGTVSGSPPTISNTALVELPTDATIEDPVPGNNSATDVNVFEALFRNGFEEQISPPD